jgi:hypothetical protein
MNNSEHFKHILYNPGFSPRIALSRSRNMSGARYQVANVTKDYIRPPFQGGFNRA